MIQRPAERTERFNKPPLYSLSLSFSIPPAMLDSLTFILEKLFFLVHIKVFSLLYVPERRRRSRSDSERDEDNNNPKTKQHFEGSPQVAPGVVSPPAAPPQQQHYQRGDLLEVPRTLFTHFGIYLGDGRVAHLIPDVLPALTRGGGPQIGPFVTNTRLVLGVLSKQASVRVDSVEDFAYGADVLRNAMDARMIPAAAAPGAAAGGPGPPPRLVAAGEEVAVRAERLVGPVPFYSLLWNNCEHYVTGCRYGDPVSLQTDKFCLWLKSVICDQRNVFRTALLGVLSMLCLGVSIFTVLPTLLVPFTLWMVS